MTRARLPTKLAKRARERSEPAGGFLEANSRSEFVERGERGSPQSSRSERVSEANPLGGSLKQTREASLWKGGSAAPHKAREASA